MSPATAVVLYVDYLYAVVATLLILGWIGGTTMGREITEGARQELAKAAAAYNSTQGERDREHIDKSVRLALAAKTPAQFDHDGTLRDGSDGSHDE